MCKCGWKENSKGLLALGAVLFYQLLCFLAFVSFSIGFSVVVTRIYEYLMGAVLPSSCEAFVSMFLICLFAEFHIFCQHECIGHAILHYYRRYSTLLPIGTSFIYTMLYIFAFTELYVQFQEAHIIRPQLKKHGHDDALTSMKMMGVPGSSEAEQVHTALFLLSLSYIVYCTMKLINYDVIEQIKHITNQASCIHCVVTLGFLGVHILMNILYAIPLLIVAFSLKLYHVNGAAAYAELNAVGILSGMVFAVIETRRPWPTARSLRPFFLYENNARAKAILGQLQIILILIVFYRPVSIGKIPEHHLDAGNDSVLLFCFFVAFTMLHYVKILTFITVQKDIDINLPPRIELIAEEGMEDVLVVASQPRLDLEGGDNAVHVNATNANANATDANANILPEPKCSKCLRCRSESGKGNGAKDEEDFVQSAVEDKLEEKVQEEESAGQKSNEKNESFAHEQKISEENSVENSFPKVDEVVAEGDENLLNNNVEENPQKVEETPVISQVA